MKVNFYRLVFAVLVVWLALIYAFFGIFAMGSGEVKVRAVFGMVSGLIVLWVVIGGGAMYLLRDHIKGIIRALPGNWRLKFIVFAVLLALLEEAVTVGMTSMAPLFGVQVGEAYITASAGYVDVVMFHSVIVFVPMFIAWAFILSKYDIKPAAVFLLFGLTGMLCESLTFGLQNFAMFGMWAFVYGLMVFLPAYAIPEDRGVTKPKVWHYAFAVVLPILVAIPLVVVVSLIHPVAIHFTPL